MKRKLIIIFISLIVTLVLFLVFKNDSEIVMICKKESSMVDGDAYTEYTFKGNSKKVLSQKLFVKLYITTEDLINNYREILKERENCSEIIINSSYISYTCNYDLTKDHFYVDIEEDGILKFSNLEKVFLEDNYLCEYKK